MNKKSVLATFLVITILGLLAWFSVGSKVYKTYCNRVKAAELIDSKQTVNDIVTVFGEPTGVYDGFEELPTKLKDDVPESMRVEYQFFYFGQEGLPAYWSFFVAAEARHKKILWGKVRDRP